MWGLDGAEKVPVEEAYPPKKDKDNEEDDDDGDEPKKGKGKKD